MSEGPYRTAALTWSRSVSARTWRGRLRSWWRRLTLRLQVRNHWRVRFSKVLFNGEEVMTRADLRITTWGGTSSAQWYSYDGIDWRAERGTQASLDLENWLYEQHATWIWRKKAADRAGAVSPHAWIHAKGPR